ncbi:Uncharacterised protein [uncultured archaeon]|nr:Uncharacterised protein [uncultured archaeon]
MRQLRQTRLGTQKKILAIARHIENRNRLEINGRGRPGIITNSGRLKLRHALIKTLVSDRELAGIMADPRNEGHPSIRTHKIVNYVLKHRHFNAKGAELFLRKFQDNLFRSAYNQDGYISHSKLIEIAHKKRLGEKSTQEYANEINHAVSVEISIIQQQLETALEKVSELLPE